MSYTNKELVRAAGNVPAPQYYNGTNDNYEVVQGENGGSFVNLLGGTAIRHGLVNVLSAGTVVQLPDISCREVTIIAKDTNVGPIFIGSSNPLDGVVSETSYGAKLSPDGSVTLPVRNTSLICINASVNGDGISFIAI
ncbi:hypothetical protein D3C74_167110 [compost metagenome]